MTYGKDSIWTPKAVDVLMTLTANDINMSYRQVAEVLTKQFGRTFTKNCCIGKARRMKLPPRPVKYRKPQRNVDAPIVLPVEKRVKGASLTIYQTREGDCKWPLGKVEDKPPFDYCGRPTVSVGMPYCLQHHKRAHGQGRND